MLKYEQKLNGLFFFYLPCKLQFLFYFIMKIVQEYTKVSTQ